MSCPRYAPLSLAQSLSSHPCTLPAVLLATMSTPSKLSARAELCYVTYLLRCRIHLCVSLLALPALSLAVSLPPRCRFAALFALELGARSFGLTNPSRLLNSDADSWRMHWHCWGITEWLSSSTGRIIPK